MQEVGDGVASVCGGPFARVAGCPCATLNEAVVRIAIGIANVEASLRLAFMRTETITFSPPPNTGPCPRLASAPKLECGAGELDEGATGGIDSSSTVRERPVRTH